MASPRPAAELREVRSLAQKLFAQCKGQDAPSSYKLLATSVRGLRNVLEEVEEDYDPTRTLGPGDIRLLGQINSSHHILKGLEDALQSYRDSTNKDVDMNAVSDLKTALDVTTHQLKVAFEATTTGEIPLKLDTRDFPDRKKPSASIEDSSASRSRKSSMWSLGPRESPRSPGASDATSVHNERADRSSGEEKQVLSPSGSSASDARASMDFRSPFADPLSMGIEAASSFLLGGDDDFSMSAYARPVSRSRAESDVSASTETFVSAPVSPEIERKPSEPTAYSAHAPDFLSTQGEPLDVSNPSQQPFTGSEEPSQHQSSRRLSDARVEETHLSPETATRELALKRTRTNSDASVKEGAKIERVISPVALPSPSIGNEGAQQSEDTSSPPSSSHTIAARSQSSPEYASSHASASATVPLPATSSPPSPPRSRATSLPSKTDLTQSGLTTLGKNLNERIDTAFAGGVTPAVPEPTPQSSPTISPPADTAEQHVATSPPPPSRRPPPPPPAVRRSNANAKLKTRSKYFIVNDAPDDSSSEDELYSTSLPSSPAKVRSPPAAQSPPTSTPTIQIDQSALDDLQIEEDPAAPPSSEGAGATITTSETTSQFPQTTYTPSSISKVPVFARMKSLESVNEQNEKPTLEESKTPQSPPSPKSPPAPRSPSSSTTSPPPRPSQSPELPPSVQKRIDGAVQASDKLLAKEFQARFQKEGKRPPVPPRPPPVRYHRPRAATANSSPATITEKEIATAEPGLELSETLLATKPKNPRLIPRVSVDHALHVGASEDGDLIPAADGTRHGRSASTSQLPEPRLPGVGDHRLTGWYGPGADDTSSSELDTERMAHIEHFWNSTQWAQAEEYLLAFLESLIEQDNMPMVRRVRHLLGVCAAYQGNIQRAITMFLAVLELSDPGDLSKPGNAEAAYWLGDLYAMTNQRLESLLAYCGAQWGDLFGDPEEPDLRDLIKAEQEAVQLGSPKSDFKARLSEEAREGCGTILDPKIMPTVVAHYLLDVEPRRDPNAFRISDKPFQLDPYKPRSSAMFSLSSSNLVHKFQRSKIWRQDFLVDGQWPLQYDPTFTLANVKRERLLGSECDLLSVLQGKEGEAKIPKVAPMSLSRMGCFTCGDLSWLIVAVRECLKMLEMEWSEVANEQGAWFVVRHTLMDGPKKSIKIATVHYFAVSLFRQSFRSSYGVEICSHGVSSARIMDPSNLAYDKGVHSAEPERIKKLIREALEEEDRKRPKTRRRPSSIGLGISRSSSDDQPEKRSDEFSAPPLPPRPKKSGSPKAFMSSSFVSSS